MPFTSDSARRGSRAPENGMPTGLAESHRGLSWPLRSLTLLVVMAFLAVSGVTGGLAPVAAQDNDLEQLREQNEAAAEALEAATDEYVERQEAVEDAQEELVEVLHDLQQTEIELREMREPLARLASTLYQQPGGGVLATLASGSLEEDLQTQSYAAKIAEDNQALIQDATDLREEQVQLASQAQELQTTTQLEQVELAAEVDALRDQAEESTDELMAELERLGLDPGTYMNQAECDASAASKADGYPNGQLPQAALCALYDDKFLRADAAADFFELNMRYVETYGENMCLTSAYRDLPNQYRVYREVPPGYAAVPGTSNHGLGQALDLGCGIQNYRSERWNWMNANGPDFGWTHPAWAKSSPFEPWHWEYGG
ncbi:D-alanyl-D-alanine carboxypeptidase family protein [Nocardiopsis sp. EMB25]|uniref:D-alanyl-D-alanine carboxypeptidase family protein n=1 Tax=Nocardiopsis TaxID=2013 RepID=UPI0004758B8E|nr:MULTISPECIES: D-alanyl-D-alanine carboxypeptidase family protein [Nocardiopsis]MCY9785927.1 D-alanyl-D-alanine carboxypeptidase family protein [Nocardiopsis sp. EMB25]